MSKMETSDMLVSFVVCLIKSRLVMGQGEEIFIEHGVEWKMGHSLCFYMFLIRILNSRREFISPDEFELSDLWRHV